MPEGSNAGGVFGSLPAWMGGKLLAGILRGNRTTNQAGIDAFRERARTTLNPPKPPTPQPTEAPPQTTVASGGSPGPTSRRAPKSKRKRIREPTREEIMQATYESYLRALQGGFSGSVRGGKYSAPPIGSKSAQRGSVGVARAPAAPKASARARRTAGPGGRTYTSSRRPGARGTGPGARAAATTAVPLDDPQLSPVEVPRRERYTDLSPVEVPARERYTGLEPVEVPNRRKYGSSPAARPGDGAVSTRRSPGTARLPRTAPAPGTATAPRTRPSAASLRIGSFELPLDPIIRALTTRKPPPAARPASGTEPIRAPEPVLTPGSNPYEQVSYAYDYDKCKCPKKKKPSKQRQPRTECRSGTYKQTARGVTYRPNKIVPCT